MTDSEGSNKESLLTRSYFTEGPPSIFMEILKGCFMCCYLICPPTPSSITRKIAFHPPQKGRTYAIYLENGKCVTNASKLIGKRFHIKPERLTKCHQSDYDELMRRVECYTLRTLLGNDIIVIKCSPEHQDAEERLSRMVIIFAQPNASDLGEYLQPFHLNIPLLAELFETDVYAFDYSGYGYSSGTVSERNIYADIRAVFDFVRMRRPNKKIVLLGYSIGTAAVADLAASKPDGLVGVVMVAPFTSGFRLFGAKPTNTHTSKLDRFTTCDKMGSINVPVLVCHGSGDEAIPVEHGLEIARRAPRGVPPLIVHGADHMSIFNGKYLQTFRRIRHFMEEETDYCGDTHQASSNEHDTTTHSNPK
ncbi:hypothetical protein Y032_0013g2018 [Ancylostoma ceylanicum]|uniref:Serine aminopeptidase S33 domain-containing protein n=1 Tax=Ancylostoma ceylanicum TaxID=53326 RepID=A0A016VAG0_9BILA|nr:hypothetical protein Y032_0013g2018 [Ancylostoma ceylanicum]